MRSFFKLAMGTSGVLFILHTVLVVALILQSMLNYRISIHPYFLQLPILLSGPFFLVLFALLFLLTLFTSKRRFFLKLITFALPLISLVTGIGYGALMVIYHKNHPPYEEIQMLYRSPDDAKARFSSIREASGRCDRYVVVKKDWGFFKITRIVNNFTREKWEQFDKDGNVSGIRTDDNLNLLKYSSITADSSIDCKEELVQVLWRNLDSYLSDKNYTPVGGYLQLSETLLAFVPYEKVVKLFDLNPFASGPHKENTLDLENRRAFGYYNPQFVKKAVDAFLRAEHDSAFRDGTKPLYDHYFKPLARGFFTVYKKLEANPECFQNAKRDYLDRMEHGKLRFNFVDNSQYAEFLSKGFCPDSTDSDYSHLSIGLDENVYVSLVPFWLRRSADGTSELFFDGLSRLLKVYDNEFLDNFEQNLKNHVSVLEEPQIGQDDISEADEHTIQ